MQAYDSDFQELFFLQNSQLFIVHTAGCLELNIVFTLKSAHPNLATKSNKLTHCFVVIDAF